MTRFLGWGWPAKSPVILVALAAMGCATPTVASVTEIAPCAATSVQANFADSWHLPHCCTRGRDFVCDREGGVRDYFRGLVLPGPTHCRTGLASFGSGGRRERCWSSLPCGAPTCNARDLGVWKPCRLQPLFAASVGFERHCDVSWGDQFSSGWDAHGRQLRESSIAAFLTMKLRSATLGDIGGCSPSPRC